MKTFAIGLALFCLTASLPRAESNQKIANEADFKRAMKELSNAGRWGADDELGAANLITPAKRRQALALAKEAYRFRWRTMWRRKWPPTRRAILERKLNDVLADGHDRSLRLHRHVSRRGAQSSGCRGIAT